MVLLNGSENRTISSTQITPSCHWTSSQAVTPGLELCSHVTRQSSDQWCCSALAMVREGQAVEERGCRE